MTDSGDTGRPYGNVSLPSNDASLAGEIEELAYRISVQTDRIAELETSLQRTQARLEESQERIRAMRERRAWRLAELLGQLRRQPSRILQLPARLADVVRGSDEPARLPQGDTEAVISDVVRDDAAVVLTLTSAWVESILAVRAPVVRLDRDDWRSQIKAHEHVAAAVIESASVVGFDGLSALVDELRRRGVRSILWQSGTRGVPAAIPFDLVVQEDSVDGDEVMHLGPIDIRLHNPVREEARTEGVAEVDPDHLAIEGVALAPAEFVRAIKRYGIVRWTSPPGERVAAAVAASGTPAVGDEDTEGRLLEALRRSEVLRARTGHTAMREAVSSAPSPRLLDGVIAGGEGREGDESIEVLVVSNRPSRLEAIFRNLGRQTYPHLALLLLTHGIQVEESAVTALAEMHRVEVSDVLHIPADVPLGEVFNRGFRQTTAPIVAKMDDDDFYGAEYMSDLKLALDFSGADVVGKWSHYVHLEASNLLVHRFKEFEHRFTELVAISTLLMHRYVFDMARFPALPYGSGSVFLRELGRQGARVYAADRWNYLYNRAADGSRHTYPLSDLQILNYAEVVCQGVSTEAVVL